MKSFCCLLVFIWHTIFWKTSKTKGWSCELPWSQQLSGVAGEPVTWQRWPKTKDVSLFFVSLSDGECQEIPGFGGDENPKPSLDWNLAKLVTKGLQRLSAVAHSRCKLETLERFGKYIWIYWVVLEWFGFLLVQSCSFDGVRSSGSPECLVSRKPTTEVNVFDIKRRLWKMWIICSTTSTLFERCSWSIVEPMWNQGQLGASELSAEISDLCSFSTNIFANSKISTFCSPKMPCSLVFTLTLRGRSTHWIPRILCQNENPLDPKRTKTAGWIWWERWPELGATLLTLKSLKQIVATILEEWKCSYSILLFFCYRCPLKKEQVVSGLAWAAILWWGLNPVISLQKCWMEPRRMGVFLLT